MLLAGFSARGGCAYGVKTISECVARIRKVRLFVKVDGFSQLESRYVTMRHMKYKSIITVAMVLTATCTFAGCGNNPTGNSTENPQKSPTSTEVAAQPQDKIARDTALSNPATVYCLEQGGKFTMSKSLDGSTEGLCVLPSNITCEEWSFYRGDCPAGAKKKRLEETTSTTAATTTISLNQNEKSQPVEEIAASVKNNPTVVEPETATEQPKEALAAANQTELVLTAEPGEDPGEIKASWKTNDLKAPDGFIIMLSGQEQIAYPTKYSEQLKNPLSRSYVWTNLVADKTYYFRVCIAAGEDCKTYSTVVSAVAK